MPDTEMTSVRWYKRGWFRGLLWCLGVLAAVGLIIWITIKVIDRDGGRHSGASYSFGEEDRPVTTGATATRDETSADRPARPKSIAPGFVGDIPIGPQETVILISPDGYSLKATDVGDVGLEAEAGTKKLAPFERAPGKRIQIRNPTNKKQWIGIRSEKVRAAPTTTPPE